MRNFLEIHVKRTLVYYNHAEGGSYYAIHTPKTEAGKRIIPMLDFVRDAFAAEKEYQEMAGIKCMVQIDGVTDFVFCNRFGKR